MARQKRRDEGSVYEYPKGSGRWFAQLTIDGDLIRRRAPTESEAYARLEELRALKRARVNVRDGAQSFEDWLNEWFALIRRQRQPKPRTVEFYRDKLELYIIPGLGGLRLLDIRAADIQRFLNQTQDEIRTTGHDGARTVRACAGIIQEALTLAHARKLIPDNPYSGIVLPKLISKEVIPLDDAQLRAFLDATADTRLAALWACYALLGLRRGEGLGLRWEGYDRTKGTLRIDQQVQRVDGRRLEVGTPKTRAGVRTLPLTRRLRALLDARYDDARAEREMRGLAWTGQGLMFPSEALTPMWPDNLERRFRDIRRAAGLPSTVKLHHLRHTVATLLDECGATQALKDGILGHAARTIGAHYTHARGEAMRRVLQAVEDRVWGEDAGQKSIAK